MTDPAARTVRAGRRRVRITNAERIVFPDVGLTKLDLARHYGDVAAVMVPHARQRPLALQSFPRGVSGDGFFLKSVPRHFPDWIATVSVPKREGGRIQHALANDAAALVYLAGQNAITLHTWTSRADRLEHPDRLIFDLDPPPGRRFADVRATARELGRLLRDIGLEPFAMTTGSRGVHVVTPLRRNRDFEAVLPFAQRVASLLAHRNPTRLTVEHRLARRADRIFVDVGRNAYGQHGVAPYSVRALPGAPVATPLHWDELSDRGLRPQRWGIGNIGARLAGGGDPWASLVRHAGSLGPASRELERHEP
ncbi:MAG: non-homologous end-joining DNA ligase [Trebonia sp.]